MATIIEDITAIEAELTEINTIIQKQQNINSSEEGGSASSFRIGYTSASTLYKRQRELKNKLALLKMGTLV